MIGAPDFSGCADTEGLLILIMTLIEPGMASGQV